LFYIKLVYPVSIYRLESLWIATARYDDRTAKVETGKKTGTIQQGVSPIGTGSANTNGLPASPAGSPSGSQLRSRGDLMCAAIVEEAILIDRSAGRLAAAAFLTARGVGYHVSVRVLSEPGRRRRQR
jgi:hypothetical protein